MSAENYSISFIPGDTKPIKLTRKSKTGVPVNMNGWPIRVEFFSCADRSKWIAPIRTWAEGAWLSNGGADGVITLHPNASERAAVTGMHYRLVVSEPDGDRVLLSGRISEK